MGKTHEPIEVGDDLEITKIKARRGVPGTWVDGTLAGHRFQALVFNDHAEVADYELGQSQISKLWVQRLADKREVYHWDRGLDRAAETETAAAIVDFLAAGLAEYVYAPFEELLKKSQG